MSCAVVIGWALALSSGGSAGKDGAASAEAYFQRAQERISQASPEYRAAALQDLAAAVELSPDRTDYWIAYGRACRESGHSSRARSCFTRAARLQPADPEVWSELGSEWKHEWLLTADRTSLEESMRCFARVTELAPERADAWCAASALLLLEGRPRDAMRAAMRARRADSTGVEPLLMLAASFYRLSVLVYADSAFRMARDRMPVALRERFDDETAIFGTRALDPDVAATTHLGPTRWSDSDPDLTTPENEALLDYRTRLALAFFLFREQNTLRWDARAEFFVRYGPPAAILYNPARRGWEADLEMTYSRPRELRSGQVDYTPGPLGYPYNLQVWQYPELGISPGLIDRRLTQSYELRPSLTEDGDHPRSVPGTVAGQPELVALGSGRGVFRALAPGARPMNVAGALSRFVVGDSTRVLAHVSALGGAADSMAGSWAIVASDGALMKRESAPLAISACDPTHERIATFVATVPPGDYRIDLSVSARGARRGVVHLRSRVEPVQPGLAMSDLVLVCGDVATAASAEAVRVEPNLSRRWVDAQSLTAYYELEHLTAAPSGETRFSFHYTIRAVDEPGSVGSGRVLIESSREESGTGSHRRQFVTASIASLAAGRYELRVQVRDVVSGGTATRAVEFEKGRP